MVGGELGICIQVFLVPKRLMHHVIPAVPLVEPCRTLRASMDDNLSGVLSTRPNCYVFSESSDSLTLNRALIWMGI